MYNCKHKLVFRIVVIIYVTILLVLSPYGKYIDSTSISNVYAADLVVAEGAAVAVEWLIALFASIGLGSAAYENRDALVSSYKEYLDAQIDTEQFVIDSVKDSCIEIYDKASNTVKNIPWQDYIDSLQEGHDMAVDGLTGLYAKYCPQLLMTYDDFVKNVLNGDIAVTGFSDAIDTAEYFSAADVVNQRSGKTYTASFTSITTYFVKNSSNTSKEYSGKEVRWFNDSISVPLAAYYYAENNVNGYIDHKINFLYRNGSSYAWYTPNSYFSSWQNNRLINNGISASWSWGCIDGGTWQPNDGYHNVAIALSGNIPIFDSSQAAIDYCIKGIGYENALNYGRSWDDSITDNVDLPPFYKTWQQELWERIANAPDVGIGSYGAGVGVNDWATDLPFIGLDDLWDYITSLQDVYEKTLDDIINGTYDPTKDIPDTYDDAWDDTITDTWDDVIDKSIPASGTKPAEGEETKPDTPGGDSGGGTGGSGGGGSSSGPWIADLSKFFPFCIPFDLIHLLSVLDADPVAPKWEVPFKFPAYGIDETIVIDLSIFDDVAKIVRLLETILFILSLILATRSLIKG